MKFLFVTPIEYGSGETITAVGVAAGLSARGHEVVFLAAPFATRFIPQHFQSMKLTADLAANHRLWDEIVGEHRPDAIVFADFPLMFLEAGCAPMVGDHDWAARLGSSDATLITFDHFGFCERPAPRMHVFGPPHLMNTKVELPALPPTMRVLRPCPMLAPSSKVNQHTSFRLDGVRRSVPTSASAEVRRRYIARSEGFLVLHTVPTWAWRAARVLGLPFYDHLPRLLSYHLRLVDLPVTVVSVNSGALLRGGRESDVTFVNLAPMPTRELEPLLLSADLILTENMLSITMGRAVVALQPAAVLCNSQRLLAITRGRDDLLAQVAQSMEAVRPGSVFPYAVFPSMTPADIEAIGLLRSNPIVDGFERLEIFAGDTCERLHRLLLDGDHRSELQESQRAYAMALDKLPEGHEAVLQTVVTSRAGV